MRIARRRRVEMRGVSLLVDDSGEETGFCDAEAYTRADELWVAGRKHDQWSLSTL